MRSDQGDEHGLSEGGRVIMFRPRQAPRRRRSIAAGSPASSRRPIESLAKYRHVRGEDEHSRALIVSALALAFCIALSLVGLWLVNEMSKARQIEDCALSGRSGCIPLPVVSHAG